MIKTVRHVTSDSGLRPLDFLLNRAYKLLYMHVHIHKAYLRVMYTLQF